MSTNCMNKSILTQAQTIYIRHSYRIICVTAWNFIVKWLRKFQLSCNPLNLTEGQGHSKWNRTVEFSHEEAMHEVHLTGFEAGPSQTSEWTDSMYLQWRRGKSGVMWLFLTHPSQIFNTWRQSRYTCVQLRGWGGAMIMVFYTKISFDECFLIVLIPKVIPKSGKEITIWVSLVTRFLTSKVFLWHKESLY